MFEDAAHDAIAAGMQLDADFLLALVAFHVGDGVGGDGAVVKLNALSDAEHVILGQGLVQNDVVKLRDFAARMGQLLGQVAVVGEQQQPRGLLVEAAYRIDALGAGVLDEFHHGVALVGVVSRGDKAFGLVEQDVAQLLAVERLAAIHHLVLGLHFVAHRGDDFVVHHDAASLDEVVGLAARADATVGQILVQADFSSGFRAVVQRVFLADIALAATAWLLVILEAATRTVVETAVAIRSVVVTETTFSRSVVVEAAAWSVVVMETAFSRSVVIEPAARTVIVVETTLSRAVVIKTAARSVVVETALTRTVIVEAATRTVVIMETAFSRAVVIKTATWSVVVMETTFSRFVIVEATARTLIVIESAARAVVIVKSSTRAVAELAVATVVETAFTSRLVAKLSLFAFFVTVAVIKLEGPSLLEHFRFLFSSGARTLARFLVVCH